MWQKVSPSPIAGSIHATLDGGAVIAAGIDDAGKFVGRIVKVDAVGNTQWERAHVLPTNAFFYSARPIPGGSYVVSGHYDTSGNNPLVITLDADGNVTATYAYSSASCPFGAALDAQFIPGRRLSAESRLLRSLRVRREIDSAGAILWQDAPSAADGGHAIGELAVSPTYDGGYAAAGFVDKAELPTQCLLVKSDSSGGLPACAQQGSPDLISVTAPSVTAIGVSSLSANTQTNPSAIAVTVSPAQLTGTGNCSPF